jgi:hypothetical protein|tara:strand:- start:507 stop:629 length:123 start_codon:yes stop_codon:yes gene_type:complete
MADIKNPLELPFKRRPIIIIWVFPRNRVSSRSLETPLAMD